MTLKFYDVPIGHYRTFICKLKSYIGLHTWERITSITSLQTARVKTYVPTNRMQAMNVFVSKCYLRILFIYRRIILVYLFICRKIECITVMFPYEFHKSVHSCLVYFLKTATKTRLKYLKINIHLYSYLTNSDNLFLI